MFLVAIPIKPTNLFEPHRHIGPQIENYARLWRDLPTGKQVVKPYVPMIRSLP